MRAILALVLLGLLPVAAAGQEKYRPPQPADVDWIAGQVRLVELDARAPGFKVLKSWPIPPGRDGRFLFGPTSGFDLRSKNGLALVPRPGRGAAGEPIPIKTGERCRLPFVYGSGDPVEMPIEFLGSGRMSYRFPVVLEVVAGAVTLCFLDADGDGWFDDLDVDLVAVGAVADLGKLKFAPFTGELTVQGTRYLVAANPRSAGLWPVSPGVRPDYVRHVAEVNAVRRFAGLPPAGLAEELIPLCEAHSSYCHVNGITHYEERHRAGYSPGGEWAGIHCNVGADPNAIESIRALLATLWHRNFYYVPALKRVSVGGADGFVCSDVLTHGAPKSRTLIFAPIDGALDVPLEGHNENPPPYINGPVPGPFVTVLLPYGTKATFVSGTVTPRGGTPVPYDVSDPANPAPQARQRFPDNDACIVLVLHEVLKADTLYDVAIKARVADAEQDFAWSFRTRGGK